MMASGEYFRISTRSRELLKLIPALDINVAFEGLGGDMAASGQHDGLFDSFWDRELSAVQFTSVNQPTPASTSTQTISPKDIFADPLMSAPPSTAFTNLTSPDVESPFLDLSYEPSPALFHDNDLTNSGFYTGSLFPELEQEAIPIERSTSNHSLGQNSSSSDSPGVVTLGSRRKSSVGAGLSHSAVSGVKPRRRKNPLPPIQVDPNDKVAVKRARNTLAARDSRDRKVQLVQSLENRIADLETEKADLEKWKNLALAHGLSI